MARNAERRSASEDGLYCELNKDTRPYYLKMIGKLTREDLEKLLKDAADDTCEMVLRYLINTRVYTMVNGEKKEINASVESSGANCWNHIFLFKYGMQGNLPHGVDPVLSDEKLTGSDLGENFVECIAMLELTKAFEESFGVGCTDELTAAHALVLNTASVRAGIDLYRLKPEAHKDDYISLHELALLAQMKITTIRNYANPKHSDPIKTFQNKKGNTFVMVKDALEWLERNSRYQPTIFPDQLRYLEPGEENPFSPEAIHNSIYNHLRM